VKHRLTIHEERIAPVRQRIIGLIRMSNLAEGPGRSLQSVERHGNVRHVAQHQPGPVTMTGDIFDQLSLVASNHARHANTRLRQNFPVGENGPRHGRSGLPVQPSIAPS
jgi:hypothetical protein